MGGLRAISSQAELIFAPRGRADFKRLSVSIPYAEVYSLVQNETGLKVFGVDFSTKMDFDRINTEWATRADWPDSTGRTIANLWTEIGHGARDRDKEVAFNSRCISFQIRSLGLSAKNLSDSYYNALELHLPDEASQPFSSIRTMEIVFSMHAFLQCATTALDYIFRFVLRNIFGKAKNFDSFARGRVELERDGFLSFDQAEEIQDVYNVRNLAAHNAPLSITGHFGGAIRLNQKGYPSLEFRIIKPDRKAIEFREVLAAISTLEEWRSFERENSQRIDLLEYANQVLHLVCSLAKKTFDRSPVRPEPLSIGPGDIVR